MTSLLRKKNFQSLSFNLAVSNSTTKTTVRTIHKIQLTRVEKKGMQLRLPEGVCAQGHMLLIKITLKGDSLPAKNFTVKKKKDEHPIEITAKVRQIENADKGFVLVTLEFVQYVEEEWDQLCGAFKERQTEVDEVVKKVKR